MYRRLPHGPSGLGRDEVARNQRARLYGAMIESISQRGYKATTVAHAIALAGVSRRAFYELFPNKEECFLATYDIVVARSRKRVLDAWAGERGWANRVHAGAKSLLDDIAEQPKGPRLVLVEALGVGPKARERMQLAGFTFERLVVGAYQLAPDGVALSQLTARGIVGGVRQVVFTRLREGRERELLSLTDEVLDWIESYRTPAVARLGVPPAMAPRQAPTPAAFLARDDRRARVLGSVVHLTLDEGYSQLTDPQIAQFAGVSTEAFHKQFPSKEEAFLAAIDEFAAEALDSVRPALEEAGDWSEGVYRAMVAFVQYVVDHEALLRIAFIDIFEVGPAIIGRLTRSVEELAKLLAKDAPEPRRGPSIAREAIAGALWAIVASYVSNSRLKRLPCAVDQLTFTVLAPYLGPKDAIAAIGAARKPLRSV
ncbi:MAG TPA: TetR/AcrR family transcriptional regulator [Solirubrobacteraceae bacterium]|jgi:AcrR family transcriptional regulator|nr:TetR/AcrR family transcriptional regulator [Solirubrobacteraceae bacterium]